jgi:S-formylglutathione hydrolase FrmB
MRISLALAALCALCVFVQPAHSQSPEAAPPAKKLPELRPNGAKYERITVHGASLVGNLEGDSPDRQVSIYLPPSYAKASTRRYPVLYLLHGFTDSDARWFGLQGKHFVNVQDAVDRAYAAGARELIIVMPDAFTKYQGSMYSSSAETGNWEAFVTRDLVAYVDKHYRTLAQRASRGLAGHSMGGYGTMRLGMKYPQMFASIYALSPCCMGANLEPNADAMAKADKVQSDADIAAADFVTKAMLASGAAWSPNPTKSPRFFDLPIANGKAVPDVIAMWAANAPLAMVPQYIPSLKSFAAIAFDAGDQDTGIAATVRTLDQMLSGYGIAHTAEIYQGNHIDHIEQRLETKVLPFFSEHLKFQ